LERRFRPALHDFRALQFLDNIAAALIGGTIARIVFRGKAHIGYLAEVVAAANAGGAGSVVGDTTTTMMWIAGVSPLDVLHAFIASGAALIVVGIPASFQQQRFSLIVSEPRTDIRVDWNRVAIVAIILLAAIATNVVVNLKFPAAADHFPFLGPRGVGRTHSLRPVAKTALEAPARGVQGKRVFAVADSVRVADAG
jgi:hypothetical protein